MIEFKNIRVCPVCGGEIWGDEFYVVFNENEAHVVMECRGRNKEHESCDFYAVAILRPIDFDIKKR